MWPRALEPHERLSIDYRTPGGSSPGVLDLIVVIELDDAGMGSIAVPNGKKRRCIADCAFYGDDRMPVIVGPFVDKYGALLEPDLWRVHFWPTQRFPASRWELVDVLQPQNPTHH